MNERTAVLIVDDDAEIQEALATLLSEAGYTVYRAHDGAQGLAQLELARSPLVVLLDLTMPVLDGSRCTADWPLIRICGAIPSFC